MAGRRRRSPGCGTASERSIRYIKEESILYPKPFNMPDEDWPCYVLTDATVYRSDGRTIANPLHVHLEGPMIIRGKLVVDNEDEVAISNLVNSATRTAYIEIKGSDRYSIGYQPTVFWLSGTAGWFEIEPSPEYETMYREVQEGITLYYSVIMVYEEHEKMCEKRKKKKTPPPPPTLDDILFRYAMTLGDGILRDEAEARCHKWAQFLIAHLSKELDIQCNDTLFALWMREKHPELAQRIKDASAGLIPPAPIPPPPEPANQSSDPSLQQRSRPSKTSARNSEDIEMTDPDSSHVSDGAKLKRRLVGNTPVPLPTYATRQPPLSQSPAPQGSSPPRVDSESAPVTEPFSVIDRLLEVFKEEVAEKNIDATKAAETRFSQAIWHRCRVRQYTTAAHIMGYYARELLLAIPSEWRTSGFYEWLKEKASGPRSLPDGLTINDIHAQLVRRVKKPKPQQSSTATLNPASLELRNRASRKSTQDFDEEADELPRHGKRLPASLPWRSGKGAVLRPPTSKKRPASDMDVDDNEDDESASEAHTGRKVVKRNRGVADDDDTDDSSDDSGVLAGDIFPISTQVPKDAVRVLVHSGRLPTMSPSGPDGTWICEQEGCGYVVREAEDQVGQELIQKHLESHQSQAEKISLAMAESRGQMPINHLLSKLQEIGQNTLLKKRGTLSNGEPLVAPIQRKVLI